MQRLKLKKVKNIDELLNHPDPFNIPEVEVKEIQLELLKKFFSENRDKIAILKRAAERKGITEIKDIQDVVPLLFSHETYKSYPESFLDKKQWNRMNQWLSTLTVRSEDAKSIDLNGIENLDDWLDRLDAYDFRLYHSSGTSGKPSFIPKSIVEHERMVRAFCQAFKHGQDLDPETTKLHYFSGAFKHGWNTAVRIINAMGEIYALPGQMMYAFDTTMSAAAIREGAKMRKLATSGKLSPEELTAFETAGKAKRAAMGKAFQNYVKNMLKYKGKRIMTISQSVLVYQTAAKGLEMGMKGLFSPDSVIAHGGGKKGFVLPDDYEKTIAEYFGVPEKNVVDFYGMTESNALTLVCEHNRKHIPPWLILLLLNKEGTGLLNPSEGEGGIITGRYAFIDLCATTYWGGIITGDQVTVSFDKCPCGRHSPQILTIDRYTDISGADEDKISCAVEMAEYIQAELTDD